MNIIIVANRNNPKTIDALFQITAYLDSQGIGHSEIDVTDLPDSAFACSAAAGEIGGGAVLEFTVSDDRVGKNGLCGRVQ